MKTLVSVVSLGAISLAFAGCASDRPAATFAPMTQPAPAAEQIVLKTVGPPGQRLKGTLKVDGTKVPLAGITPEKFRFTCGVLEGDVTKVRGEGTFGFQVIRADGSEFFTPLQETVCRFRYQNGGLEVLTAK